MTKFLFERDCDTQCIKNKKIAVIGYGSQGYAQANNLKDSGLDVLIGLYGGSRSWEKAESDGFKVLKTAEAVLSADIIMLLVSDEKQPDVYSKDIERNLKMGQYMGFSHGFNIHFSQIMPPDFVNVFMVSPKGPGLALRANYLNGSGLPCLFAVYQDLSRDTRDIALAYACAIGGGRSGLIESSFKEETETDLFGEQSVICGGISELILAGFETLVSAGYNPYVAYIECLFETKAIVDLIIQYGIAGMRERISNTAEFGDYVSGKAVINNSVRNEMKRVLSDIQSGKFARKWIMENKTGLDYMKMRRKLQKEHPIEKAGKYFRDNINYR